MLQNNISHQIEYRIFSYRVSANLLELFNLMGTNVKGTYIFLKWKKNETNHHNFPFLKTIFHNHTDIVFHRTFYISLLFYFFSSLLSFLLQEGFINSVSTSHYLPDKEQEEKGKKKFIGIPHAYTFTSFLGYCNSSNIWGKLQSLICNKESL